MGVSLSWLAVRGKSVETVRRELQLRGTGNLGDIPGSPFVGSVSDSGWHLIVARGCEHRIVSTPVLERLSIDCEVLTCTVEEHVMFSEATGWRNGKRLWTVTHKGEDGPKGISADGALPEEYPAIRDGFISRQEAEGGAKADVDLLFEIPVVLVQTFIDYKHDEESPAFERHGFELLESTHKSFFQRLFSK
jgi:hypothetical protein